MTTTVTIPSNNHLFPGKSVNLTGDITNPNEFKVKINSVSITGVTSTKDGGSNTGCVTNTADLSAVLTGSAPELNAGQTLNNRTFGTLTMGQNAAAACAGSTITATLTFAGELIP
ncbi:hypothetical protein [Actinoplanes sp. NPDC049118]|uniref:hypothetical protein n=1 Tax=Actinoplanes sp. NPDC049118 TaxID=3155769 RepID=UPI0033C02BEF